MTEEFPYALMERAWKIMRKSISTYLNHFQYYATASVLLMLPFSATALLISQTLFSSSQISLELYFSSPKFTFFPITNTKSYFSSQTFFSSVLIMPFALSSLLLSKASIIQALKDNNNPKRPCSQTPFFSCLSLYKPLLITQLFNMILSVSIIASTSLISTAFSSLEAFGFFNAMLRTICGLVFYAIITNTAVLCNLSLAVAGLENCAGYKAMHKAYLLRKGSNSIAMLLALPTNIGLASIEALFCLRVVRAYNHDLDHGLIQRPSPSMAFEGILIAYLYSIVVVLDTIACCLFLKSCRSDSSTENPIGFCNNFELV